MRAIALLPQTIDPPRAGAGSQLRFLLVIGAATGALAALTLFLWVSYGSAAYYEQMAAGLGICF